MSQKISFSRSEGIPTLISQKSCRNIYTIYVLSLCLIEKIFARCDFASDSHQLPIFPSSFLSHLHLPSQRETKILLSLFFRFLPSWKHKLALGININCVNIERALLIWLSNLYWNFREFLLIHDFSILLTFEDWVLRRSYKKLTGLVKK